MAGWFTNKQITALADRQANNLMISSQITSLQERQSMYMGLREMLVDVELGLMTSPPESPEAKAAADTAKMVILDIMKSVEGYVNTAASSLEITVLEALADGPKGKDKEAFNEMMGSILSLARDPFASVEVKVSDDDVV